MSEQSKIDFGVIAKICHQANKALCEQLGDNSQKDWDQAAEWQRESAIKGVQFRIENPDAPISAQHESWMKDKIADGWKYGEVKSESEKTHPCLVEYDELPEEQKAKDALFVGIVLALAPKKAKKEKSADKEKAK